MTEKKINNLEKEKKSSLVTIRRMTIDDIAPVFHLTEADNHSALQFFEKMGFEKPKKHIYLSLNLDSAHTVYKEKEKKKNHKE